MVEFGFVEGNVRLRVDLVSRIILRQEVQVSSSNGSLQNRYFSEAGRIGGIHLPGRRVVDKKR